MLVCGTHLQPADIQFDSLFYVQVQDVHREGEEKEKDNENQDDIKNEENGIEMSEDFEGKMHDMEPQGIVVNSLVCG